MSKETSNNDLQREIQQLNNIIASFEQLFRSIILQYEAIQQNLDALKTSVNMAQSDCVHLVEVLQKNKAILKSPAQAGIQKGGTG